jgi:hypothetical protein
LIDGARMKEKYTRGMVTGNKSTSPVKSLKNLKEEEKIK